MAILESQLNALFENAYKYPTNRFKLVLPDVIIRNMLKTEWEWLSANSDIQWGDKGRINLYKGYVYEFGDVEKPRFEMVFP
jgi:hypothetical protein